VDDLYPTVAPAVNEEPAPASLVPGYEVLEELGRGGMGVVYLARQAKLDRVVALKMILGAGHGGDEARARFQTEAQAVARLQHAGIVQIHDFGEAGGLPWFSLEYIDGGSLQQKLAGRPLPAQQAAALAEQLARAMHYAHSHGVVHRDLKPANVLLQKKTTTDDTESADKEKARQVSVSDPCHRCDPWLDCSPKITDFGLAKLLDADSKQTQSGAVMGTPSYMAPEQARGQSGQIGAHTDVYALGAILYEMLIGRPPFLGASVMDTLAQVVTLDPLPPRRLQPGLPRDLETICLKCLEKEPSKRYPSAAALADDLKRFLDGEPIVARPISTFGRAAKWARRRPAVAGLSATVLVLSVAAFALVTWKWREAVDQRRRADEARRQEEFQRNQAEAAQRSESEARNKADKFARESHDRLVRSYETQGVRLTEEGDLLGALPWFAGALKEDRGDPQREKIHRTRLATAIWFSPRLVETLFAESAVEYAEFSPDGRHVVTATVSGKARLWDVATGGPVGPAMSHPGFVTHAAFSPDGRRVVTACVLGNEPASEVRLWSVATGKPLTPPRKLPGVVFLAAFSPSGDRLLTATRPREGRPPPGEARVWNASTLEPVSPPLRHPGALNSACFSPDGRRVLTASQDGTARIQDAATGKPLGRSLRYRYGFTFASFSPDGGRVVTAGGNRAQVHDAVTGEPAGAPLQHSSLVKQASFSPDGQSVVTASWDRTAQVWRVATGARVGLPLRHDGHVVRATFSPDGQRVLTVGADNTARVWNAFTGAAVSPPLRHNGEVRHAAFSPDGKRVLTASGDETVRIWDMEFTHQRLFRTLQETGDGLQAIAVSPDGRRFLGKNAVLRPKYPAVLACCPQAGFPAGLPWAALALNSDQSIPAQQLLTAARVWSLTTGKPLTPLLNHPVGVDYGLFSADGRRVLTVGTPKRGRVTLWLWDAETGQALTGPITPPWTLNQVAISSDGRWVATVGGSWGFGGAAQVQDTRTGRLAYPPLRHAHPVLSASFSRDGQRLVTTAPYDIGGPVRVWDVASGRPVAILRYLDWTGVRHASFSPDGRRLVLSTFDGTVHVWDLAASDRVGPALRHGGRVNRAAFSPDGKRVVTAGKDRVARVWEVATGKPLTPPLRHRDEVVDASFSPDGRLVVTAAWDHTARVWDAATGLPVSPPLEHSGYRSLISASFTPDGKRLLTTASTMLRPSLGQRGVWIWDLSVDDRPAREVALLAECLAGQHLDSTGSYAPLNWSDALDHWDVLVASRPGRWPLHYRRGRAHAEKRQWEQAIGDYTRAIELGARVGDVWYHRSKAHAERKQWGAALADVTKAHELGYDDLSVWAHRGSVYRMLGRYERSAEDYSQMIKGYPTSGGGWVGRAFALAALHQWDKAEKDYARAQQLGGLPAVFVHQHALVRLAVKDMPGYRKMCGRLLELSGPSPVPDTALWAGWTGALLPDSGVAPERLVQLAERAAAPLPESRDSLLVRGAALYRAGRWEEALVPLEAARTAPQGSRTPPARSVRWNPEAFNGTGYELLFLAMAHHRLGHADEARRWLDRAARWMEQAPLPKTREGGDNPLYCWNQRLPHEVLRREAEALLRRVKP
jgi:WD40 repeat protein/serine/threonine protein kinase/tetratricopeptide (TPR) repeat protein